MSRTDDIAAAELASLVGGHLRSVENKVINPSSTDAGNQLDPRDFLNTNSQRSETTTNDVVPTDSIIEAPKSKSAGSISGGVETVNVENLLIPIDGADKEMKKAINRHTLEANMPITHPPTSAPALTPTVVGHATPIKNTNIISSQEVIDLLKGIDKKLDLLLKRAKIQPRYKRKRK